MIATERRPSRNSLRRHYVKMLQFVAAMTDQENAEETIRKLAELELNRNQKNQESGETRILSCVS